MLAGHIEQRSNSTTPGLGGGAGWFGKSGQIALD